VREDLPDHRTLQDRRDDLHLHAAAPRAALQVDVEHPLQQPRPAHALRARPHWLSFLALGARLDLGGRVAEAGLEPSVGSVGDSYDNALAETINGLYKAEVIHRKSSWRTRDEVEWATLNWVDWFNNRRLLEPIGNIPPAEAEANYYSQSPESVMSA
jgi:hypothetical protein